MKKKMKILLIFILSLIFIMVSCKSKEKVKNVEKEDSIIQEGKIEYNISEYKMPIIENRDSYVLKADKNKLYILVEYPQDEDSKEGWNINGHESLIVYDFQNEKTIETIKFPLYTVIVDLIVDSGDVYISYRDLTPIENKKDLEEDKSEELVKESEEPNNPTNATDKSRKNNRNKVKNNIAKIEDDGSLKIIDELYREKYDCKFVKLQGDIYYSYEEDEHNGIKILRNDLPEEFYIFDYTVKGEIYSNNNNIFTLVETDDGAYFYCINEDGDVDKIYIEGHEQIYDYNFLETGIMASYSDIFDGEKTKFMYINLKDERKKIYDKEILYYFISNNTDNCIMLDSSMGLHYLYIKDGVLHEKLLEDFTGNNIYIFRNESTRYGLVDKERNIYIDVYFE